MNKFNMFIPLLNTKSNDANINVMHDIFSMFALRADVIILGVERTLNIIYFVYIITHGLIYHHISTLLK